MERKEAVAEMKCFGCGRTENRAYRPHKGEGTQREIG